MPIGRIQLKHGLESSADFNTMLQAEAYYATDTERLMIANGDGTGLILPSKNEIDTKIGNLTSLTTTEKGSIVGAVNEIDNNLNLVQPISGSNANGSWTKFPDGTMICRHIIWTTTTIDNAVGSLFTSPNEIIWTFPQSFFGDIPSVKFNSEGIGLLFNGSGNTATPTNVTRAAFYVMSPVTRISMPIKTSCVAIGAWK